MNELKFPTKETIKKLTKDLNLKGADEYTQDWEDAVVNSNQLSEYISYYKDNKLNLNEKSTLMRLILEAYNDVIEFNPKNDKYGKEIKDLLINDYPVHEETIKYWSCDSEDLEDCFAITPFIRECYISSDK